jgi:hypothetical protein
MTQLPDEGAVGGTNDEHVVAAELTPEERLDAAFGAEDTEDEPLETEGDEPTAESEDEIEVEAEDLPPIDAPISWDAEAKAKFAELPRDVQEYLGKRETEREKFVQSKAQEAAQARTAVRNEALQYAAQLQAETAQQLERYAQQLTVAPPDASLYAMDPQTYAQQLQAYQHYTAQSQQAQREAENARAQQAQYEAALAQEEQQSFVQQLSEHFPEYLDPQRGPQLARELSAIANDLGYPAELISQARPHDILAMRQAAEWKAKAEKFDKAMAKQMERVRDGKKLKPVAKPGVASQPGARVNAGYQADREAMKRGDKHAATRVLDSFFP